MIEALARVRNDAVLSRPMKKAAQSRALFARAAERVRSAPPRLVVGAVLSALLVGIGVNALVLQRGRHPAPLFAPPPQKIAAPAPVASVPPPSPAAASAAPSPRAVPAPAAEPAAKASGESAPRRAPDAIGDFLRGETSPPADNARLVAAAQSALAKLGYPVKADGAHGGATDQALREFERAHGLPASTEITPHLLKQLNAAARSAAR